VIEITGIDQRNCSPSLREDTQHLEVWQSQSQKPENYQEIGRKGKIASRLECHSNQIHQLESAIKGIEKEIKTLKKHLNNSPLSFGISTSKSPRDLQTTTAGNID
jgi:flagellar biosynthesis chaperone FliJ